MKAYTVRIITRIIYLLGLSPMALANEAAFKEYFDKYVEAVNSSNQSAFEKLLHPSFFSCLNDANQTFFADRFKKDLERHIPEEHKLNLEAMEPGAIQREVRGAEAFGLPYTVPPTHTMTIDYNKSEYSFVTIQRKLSLQDGTFYEVTSCPSAEILERHAQLKIKKEKRRLEALKLFEELKQNNSLYEKLSDLMHKGQKIQAYKLYSAETGQDIAMAKEVLELVK